MTAPVKMTTFSVKVEYMAFRCHKGSCLIEDIAGGDRFPQVSVTIIFADNQGCIALTQNPVNHSCAKHIDIQHHFLLQMCWDG